MGELVDRDQEHLALVKLGFYVMAVVNGFYSLFSLLYIAMGGFFALGLSSPAVSNFNPRLIGAFVICVGFAFLLIGTAATFLAYFAGRSIGERRRRIFCMVEAGFLCLSVPFGTAVGVCAIIVLNRPTVRSLFEGGNVPPTAPPGVALAPP